MDDLQKAALLLKHLSADERSLILSRLDEEQRNAIEQSIEQAPEVSKAELVGIVAEYQTWLRRLNTQETSTPQKDEQTTPTEETSYLTDSQDLVRLKELLAGEPGTVQAAVLCHIAEPTARELFHSFSVDQQNELVERLPQQRPLSPLIWDELSLAMNEATSPRQSRHERGKHLLKQLISEETETGISEGSLNEEEQALVEEMKDN